MLRWAATMAAREWPLDLSWMGVPEETVRAAVQLAAALDEPTVVMKNGICIHLHIDEASFDAENVELKCDAAFK